MNNVIFKTGGDWDTTTLFNNDSEVLAERLFVEAHAGRDEYGEPVRGGVNDGGQMTAAIYPQDGGEVGIFPGRAEFEFPGHSIVIENTHPAFAFEFTQVWYNGEDVTNKLVDIYIDVDAGNNNVKAYITLYRPHFLAADEVATINIV